MRNWTTKSFFSLHSKLLFLTMGSNPCWSHLKFLQVHIWNSCLSCPVSGRSISLIHFQTALHKHFSHFVFFHWIFKFPTVLLPSLLLVIPCIAKRNVSTCNFGHPSLRLFTFFPNYSVWRFSCVLSKQHRVEEMKQMASRPFAKVCLALTNPHLEAPNRVSLP